MRLPWHLFACALAIVALSSVSSPQITHAVSNQLQMAIDADPTTGAVDASTTVPGTGAFKLGMNVTSVTAPQGYQGYQVELQFPNAGLDFVATTHGSMFTYCQTPFDRISADNSTEYVQDACAKSAPGSTFTGQLQTISLRCAQIGTYSVHMITYAEDATFGTTAFDPNAQAISTGTADATVTCVTDTDGDGCPDSRESGADWRTGGQRGANNSWDFTDMPVPASTDPTPSGPRNKAIGLTDVLATLFYVGTRVGDAGHPNANGVTYDSVKDGDWFNANAGVMGTDGNVGPDDAVGRRYDRTPSTDGSKPWLAGPPNGSVSLFDALVTLSSVGTNCR